MLTLQLEFPDRRFRINETALVWSVSTVFVTHLRIAEFRMVKNYDGFYRIQYSAFVPVRGLADCSIVEAI